MTTTTICHTNPYPSQYLSMSLSSLALDSNPIRVPQPLSWVLATTTSDPLFSSLPKPHRLLLSLSLSLSIFECSRIEHNPRNQPDWVSESSIRIVGLSVDKGKGKLVDILAHHFDIVARCQVHFFPDLLAVGRRGRNRTSPTTSQPLSLSKPRSFSLSLSLSKPR